MSNNDDNLRRNRDRPEDNPFIAFRRFADSQVSSLLNTVFTLPATIANYNNIHQAREACLFSKADKAQCDKLREIEDDIVGLRDEGRELYRVGDLQGVLKKSDELLRLDRHAEDLRKNIVGQSSPESTGESEKNMVQKVANKKGQEWGWDWSWGFPKPFDEDDQSSGSKADGRPELAQFLVQTQDLHQRMEADAKEMFGEEAWGRWSAQSTSIPPSAPSWESRRGGSSGRRSTSSRSRTRHKHGNRDQTASHGGYLGHNLLPL
jgi:hypothetical protein